MNRQRPFLLLLIGIASVTLLSQAGHATATQAKPRDLYPVEWPQGPSRASLPEWAKPGRIRFARWDGGRIETAKAFLSGWPGFNPPIPDYVNVMTNWYDPATVSLLRQANINMIWVTFSNGFSIPTERRQREQLRRYIAECHRQGIHVMAYESINNVFRGDMFQHVPASRNWLARGKDGKPVPYGAANYNKIGRITRYMADLSNPGWRDYLRKRIDLAIDAGADGIIYDNSYLTHQLFSTWRDIYRYASARKKDFILMGNYQHKLYVFNHLNNSITTEDGNEPGIFPARGPDAQAAGGAGVLVNNIGLFRLLLGLSDGWKPVMVEDGQRRSGGRLTNAMSAARHELALGEGMMFGLSMELFVEGRFAHDLWYRNPEAMKNWRAIGQYNRFFADNKSYYVDTRSLASVALVVDDRGEGVALLDKLGAQGVIYDVYYESDLTLATLRRYDAVVLLTARTVRERPLSAIEQYVAGGGKLVAFGDAATRDDRGYSRPRPGFFGRKTSKGECLYYGKLPAVDKLAAMLRSLGKYPRVRVEAPAGVLYNVVEQPQAGRLIVHLLNYTLKPTGPIKLTVAGNFRHITLLSPDSPRAPVRVRASVSNQTKLEVPSLKIYSVIVLEQAHTK